METKVCTKCGEKKEVSEFESVKVKGKIYIRGRCKSCNNKEKIEWANSHKERKRIEFFNVGSELVELKSKTE